MRAFIRVFLVLTAIAGTSSAQLPRDAAIRPSFEPARAPRRLLSPLALAGVPVVSLGGLTVEEEAALKSKTAEDRLPKIGVVRQANVSFDTAARGGRIRELTKAGEYYVAAVESTGAAGIRMRLNGDLPHGAEIYVGNEEGQFHGPFTRDVLGTNFYTPTIESDTAFIGVAVPASNRRAFSLTVSDVVHLTANVVPNAFECFVDASCYGSETWPGIANARNGIALLSYVKDGAAYTCTGALVVDREGTFKPYLLTANHCFNTQASAASLEAFWTYKTDTCNGPVRPRTEYQRTVGATLLATRTESDFTFVLLNQNPPGQRVFFGWDPRVATPVAGLRVYRLHHPLGVPQSFSYSAIFQSNTTFCGFATNSFLYSEPQFGGVFSGSSGAPLVTAQNGQILGQLTAGCGTNLDNPCDYGRNFQVDGAFYRTYPFIEQWLEASSGGPALPPPCVPSTNTFCTWSNRFEVKLSARDQRSGNTDSGFVMQSTDVFGYFALPNITFNSTDPALFVKVLDGRPVNGKWWVFFATLTDVEFTVTVRDTQTGQSKNFYKAPGATNATFDTNAF